MVTHPESWHQVVPQDVPDEGRVRSVTVDGRSIALTRCGGRLGALENHCPHQGGPLGEGSIEQGLLRCPWHGYDYDYDGVRRAVRRPRHPRHPPRPARHAMAELFTTDGPALLCVEQDAELL